MRIRHAARNDGLKRCNSCGEVKARTEFGTHALASDGRASRCRACEKERMARIRHGLTADEKSTIAAAQGGCAICGCDDPGPKGWVVDHDRSCHPGERSCPSCRRGILCHWCNTALGYAMDSPEILRLAAAYVEKHRERRTGVPGCSRACDCTSASMCDRNA